MTTGWTVRDFEVFPLEDGTRYEIIDGELYVTTQPSWEHQIVTHNCAFAVGAWNRQTGAGVTIPAPGILFAEDSAVAPDLVWVSRARLPVIRGADHKLHAAPELMVEVLSPGDARNIRRDREVKLGLYSRTGVLEYWIIDWVERRVEVYRRAGQALRLAATLMEGDVVESPLFPGFSCPVSDLFIDLPEVPSPLTGEG